MKKIISFMILVAMMISVVALASCSRECKTCGGATTITCDVCGGDKIATCSKCNGTKFYVCDICEGRGWRHCVKGCEVGEDCEFCVDGWLACSDRWPCVDCGYDGEVDCTACDDNGVKDCPDC